MNVLTIIAANAPTMLAVLCAGWLSAHDKDGWGWFLALASMFGVVARIRTKDDADDAAMKDRRHD